MNLIELLPKTQRETERIKHVSGWTWKHKDLDRLCPEINVPGHSRLLRREKLDMGWLLFWWFRGLWFRSTQTGGGRWLENDDDARGHSSSSNTAKAKRTSLWEACCILVDISPKRHRGRRRPGATKNLQNQGQQEEAHLVVIWKIVVAYQSACRWKWECRQWQEENTRVQPEKPCWYRR